MKVLPSVDITRGIAVKRIRGVPGTGLRLGNPLEVARGILADGYESIHVVDLDAAEGVGNNDGLVSQIPKLGFKWAQVGGGVREKGRALKLLGYGYSAVVTSTLPLTDPSSFSEILKELGKDKVLVSLDYDGENVLIRGWKQKAMRVNEAVKAIGDLSPSGIILTYVRSEGTGNGVDEKAGDYVKGFKGVKEYAGGIASMDDLMKLKRAGFDYAIIGMAYYTGAVRGVREV